MAGQSDVRAGGAYVELMTKDNLRKGLDAAAAKLKAFGSAIRTIGARITALGAAIGAPLLGAAKVFADTGDQLDKMSIRTGVSVEALSELAAAAGDASIDLATIEGGIRTVSNLMTEAAKGSSEAHLALRRVGLSFQELKNQNPEEQLTTVLDALQKIPNAAVRASMAQKLVGNTSLLQLGGREAIEGSRTGARARGQTLTTADAKAAAELATSWGQVTGTIKTAVAQIGGALAPTLIRISNYIRDNLGAVVEWIKENKVLILTIGGLSVALVALGVTLGIVGAAFTVIGTAIGIVSALIGVLLTPIGLVGAAFAGVVALILTRTQQGQEALSGLGKTFGSLADTFSTAWQGVKSAIEAGDLQLALKIVGKGLEVAWKTVVSGLKLVWLEFRDWFLNAWEQALVKIIRTATSNRFGQFFNKVTPGPELNADETARRAEINRLVRDVNRKGVAEREENALKPLREELKQLVEEAGRAAEGARQKRQEELDRANSQVNGNNLNLAASKARGTFSGFAAGLLGGGDTDKQILNENRKQNDKLEKLLQEIKKRGVFV